MNEILFKVVLDKQKRLLYKKDNYVSTVRKNQICRRTEEEGNHWSLMRVIFEGYK